LRTCGHVSGPTIWNDLPADFRSTDISLNSLSVALRAGYLSVRTAEGASEKQSSLKARLRNGLTYLLNKSCICYLYDEIELCLLLRLLIAFIHDRSQMVWRGYLYAVLLFVVAFVQSMMLHQYFHRCMVIGMRIRSALVAAVYKKVFIFIYLFIHLLNTLCEWYTSLQ